MSDVKISTEGKIDIVVSANFQDKLSLTDFDRFYFKGLGQIRS